MLHLRNFGHRSTPDHQHRPRHDRHGNHGMHTANPISGEFSVGVSGFWVERGRVVRPAKEAVISGTVLDLFKGVVLVGDDLIFYGNIGAPSLLIEGIDISG